MSITFLSESIITVEIKSFTLSLTISFPSENKSLSARPLATKDCDTFPISTSLALRYSTKNSYKVKPFLSRIVWSIVNFIF